MYNINRYSSLIFLLFIPIASLAMDQEPLSIDNQFMVPKQTNILTAKQKRIAEDYMTFLASSIDYSVFGAAHSIKRPGYKDYAYDDEAKNTYAEICSFMGQFNYSEAYKIIFKKRIADCCEQALYLALMLKKSKSFDNFLIFLGRVNLLDFGHSFVVAIPRNSEYIRDQSDKLKFNVDYFEMIKRNDVVILDPLRQKLLMAGKNLNDSNHPMDFVPARKIISWHQGFLTNMDLTFKAFAAEFYDFHRKNVRENVACLKPHNLPGTMLTTLENGDFNLAFMQSCTDKKYSNTTQFIFRHAELLGVDVIECLSKLCGNDHKDAKQ